MVIRPRYSLTALCLCLMASASCSGARDPDADWDGSVRDSAGVGIVLNHGAPLWKESDQWVLSQALKIGTVEGEPAYLFGRIDDMAILSDGTIVIADGMAQQLRYFDQDGHWVKTVGQAGSGPGEFGWRGLTILVGPGDTLLVYDLQNLRMDRIAPDGTWLDSRPDVIEEGWVDMGWDYSPSGRIVTHRGRFPLTESDAADSRDYVVSRDFAGSIVDTVGSMRPGKEQLLMGGREEAFLYAGSPAFSLCPDNSLLTGHQDRYEISRYDSAGKLLQVVRLDRENVPLTEVDQALLLRHYGESYLEGGYFTPAQVDNILSAWHFTEAYPAFATLMCGPGGSIWIRPWRPVSSLTEEEYPATPLGSDAYAAPQFDVFDRRGRYLGVIPLPAGFWPYRFHGDSLVGRWRDSLDVEHVMIMAIERMAAVPGS